MSVQFSSVIFSAVPIVSKIFSIHLVHVLCMKSSLSRMSFPVFRKSLKAMRGKFSFSHIRWRSDQRGGVYLSSILVSSLSVLLDLILSRVISSQNISRIEFSLSISECTSIE